MANHPRVKHSRAKVVVGGVVIVAAVAGGGVAWAATRSSGPSYRLASVTRGNVDQDVTEVGTIASAAQATLSFPVSGTVGKVDVKVGDRVTAGQTVATLETASLQTALDSAKASVASAQQRLASDQASETATATTTAAVTSAAASSGTALSTDSDTEVALIKAAPTATPSGTPTRAGKPGGGGNGGGSGSVATDKADVQRDQHAVVTAQAKLDALLTGLSGDVKGLQQACATSTVTFTTVSDADGLITGTIDGASGLPIALVNGTDAAGSSVPPGTVASNGAYSFGSKSDPLKANATYTVQLGDSSAGFTATQTCTQALRQVQDDENNAAAATKSLTTAINTLDAAVDRYYADAQAAAGSTGGGTPTRGSTPTGGAHSSGTPGSGTRSSGTGSGAGSGSRSGGTTARTGSGSTGSGTGGSGGFTGSGSGTTGSGSGTTGSGSTGSGSSGSGSTTITGAQIAADQKAIDAAKAERAVARQQRDQTVLATPISGTVAAAALIAGQSVSAGSSSSTITVIGNGQKLITTTVGIADIDLVKRGDPVSVTVDGVSAKLPGRVTLIGIMNTSGTSGTTTTYPVTVLLDKTNRTLYDGAGATVAIDVGTKKNVLTVPTSAVHRTAVGSTVDVYSGGKVTTTRVVTGIRGVGTTEITSGLKNGQRVVIAVVSAAIPSSDSATNGRRGGATGLLGGTSGVGGGARFAGGGGGGPGGGP